MNEKLSEKNDDIFLIVTQTEGLKGYSDIPLFNLKLRLEYL